MNSTGRPRGSVAARGFRSPQERRHLTLERLEDRSLFSVSPMSRAVPLAFSAFQTAQVSERLSTPGESDLYRVALLPGDTLRAQISARNAGRSLSNQLRVLNGAGVQLVMDSPGGGDAFLRFQAASAGDYFLSVSAPDGSTGLYDLSVARRFQTPHVDLVASSLQLGTTTAVAGETVPVQFSIENRGAADPGNFQVQVLLSDTNLLGPGAQPVLTLTRAQLIGDAAGRRFTAPAQTLTIPPGWLSGRFHIGLRILPDPNQQADQLPAPDTPRDGVNVAQLTILAAAPAASSDLTQVAAALNIRATGTLASSSSTRTYTVTVNPDLGFGRLTATVARTVGTLTPRLTLSGADGTLLLQSEGQIAQHLQPGTYLLTISARGGSGDYRLDTTFVASSQPFAPLPGGVGVSSVDVGDFNNDGFYDFATADRLDQVVSVFLGNGDGTFQPRKTYAAGPRMWRITVGDVNSDNIPDLLTGNKGDNTVSVLIGNGDGTFQEQRIVPAGIRVGGATVADVNGDGVPDMIQDNYAEDTVYVLLGNGDNTFQAPHSYRTDDNGRFQGPVGARAADVSGDGIPDLLYATYIGENVIVRVGLGDGTFGPEQKFSCRLGAYAPFVADLDGDGLVDLAVVNSVDNSVSILLNQGGWQDGSGNFAPQTIYSVGANPYGMIMADVNGDGKADFITNNRDGNTVSVLLGNGDGTFQPHREFLAGKTTRRVAAADFNNDGRVDLVTANQGDNTATVLMGRGDGTFVSGVESPPAPDVRPFQVVVADLNGDGRADVATANRSDHSVGVLLSNPDGSFQSKESFGTDLQPFGIAAADLNGDGATDLLTANYAGGSVSFLLGNGDGTFQPHQDLTAGSNAYGVQVDDVNNDGILDVVCTNKNDNTIGVFLGLGGATFQTMVTYAVASGPYELKIRDLNRDGNLDVVVSHFSAEVVDVLLGRGDGTFEPTRQFPVGSRPYGLTVADLDGDGIPDIATSNYRSSNVSVLRGNGDGTFQEPELMPAGSAPNEVQVGDVNGDGIPDLVTANYGSDNVSVLLGQGGGNFAAQQTFPAGSGPASVAVADVNGDGVKDLTVTNRNASSVHILHGQGDGRFAAPIPFGVTKNRYSQTLGDVNGDGKPDLVTTRLQQNAVVVQLGNGTGTFEPGQARFVGAGPVAVSLADLNGDGRTDLVTVNSNDNTIAVLLGNGDGTFSSPQSFAVGRSPRAVQIADVNGDGIRDLIVANYHDGNTSVLLGRGDGTFAPQQTFSSGQKPYALSLADVNGDGRLDLLVANSGSDTVSVLLGTGAGGFQTQQTFHTGRQPFSMAVADVTGDGQLDILTGDAFDNTVSVLAGNGAGGFAARRTVPVGARPYSVAVADLNGDGSADLAVTNYRDQSLTILLNQGDGTFADSVVATANPLPTQSSLADVNNDGRLDLVTVTNQSRAIAVQLGRGDGTFQAATATTEVGLRGTPLLVDLDQDGMSDRVVLNRSGEVLFRKGLPVGFASPVVLNPDRPAAAIALVRLSPGLAIAVSEARVDLGLSVEQLAYSVSLFQVNSQGLVTRRTAFATASVGTRLLAADLNSDGRDDLVLANSLADSVTIALQQAPGRFADPQTRPTGRTPSDLALADLNGDGRQDVLVSNQVSGDITVLLNDPTHSFSTPGRFRAGSQSSTLSRAGVNAVAQSVSLATGDFTGDGRMDVVVVNRGEHGFTVLTGNGQGGFAQPQLEQSTATSEAFAINERPGAIGAGDFNRDGKLDLAVLMEDAGQLWIYTGQGNGVFRPTFRIPVGDQATGLKVVAGTGRGVLDLVVGNGFGDLLRLEGKGDGTFQISGKRVSLSVIPDLFGEGQPGVLVGNQQDNRVTVQGRTSSGFAAVETLAGADSGTRLAPGDVQWSRLSREGTLPDAVVVSTGSNAIVVYRTIGVQGGAPTFATTPQTYFVGTSPASVRVSDLNGDGVPDMVVSNPGSNDVSVLLGTWDAAGAWAGTPGPRLRSGGAGPIAALAGDRTGDGIPDLLVTNSGSGTVTLLPGVGQGFFDDRSPQTLFDLGGAMLQAPTFVEGGSVGYALMSAGKLVRFDLNDPGVDVREVFAARGMLAVRALASGQVVVAFADGTVKVLSPQGDGLRVVAQLRAQGGVPTLPSSLEVLQTRSGQFQVLVSSQGSDNVFVFSSAMVPQPPATGGNTPGASPNTPGTPVSVIVPPPVASNPTSSPGSGSTGTSSSPGGLTTGALSGTLTLSSGLATVSAAAGEAVGGASLVGLSGSAYAAVALLDSGVTDVAERGDGRERQPGLSLRRPLGDVSPLSRFVTGLDEALQLFRQTAETRSLPEEEMLDPWREDLFHQQRPSRPRGSESRSEDEENTSAEVFLQALMLLCVGGAVWDRQRAN